MSVIPVLDAVTNIFAISAAAVLGVLTRAFVSSLFDQDGARVTSTTSSVFVDLPANVLGCFVLGSFTTLKARFFIPSSLSIAISTGYAGSLTSMFNTRNSAFRRVHIGHWRPTHKL